MGYEARHWVRLTAACNNKCIFCLDAAARMGEMLPFRGIMEDLQRGRDAGITRAVLSGGEPTIHPRFIEIIEETRKMGYTHIQVVSNGRYYSDPAFLDKCIQAGLKETTISVHGHTAELHDVLVDAPGAFKETLAGLVNALKRPELIVSVDVVLNKMNMAVIDDMMWFFVRLGVREFDLLHVIPFSSAWDHWQKLNYDPMETQERFHKALKIARNMGVTIWTNRLRAKYLEGFENLIQNPQKLHDEVRGRNKMFTEYLTSGKMMHCRGKRCEFCFMEGWCDGLIALRKKGSMKGHSRPKCLPEDGTDEGKKAAFEWDGPDTDLNKWTQFFIDHRYYVKGSVCEECAYNKACEGASINFIKENGFRALTAQKKPQPTSKRRKTCRN